jgi:uncharacterized protein YbaA (DUF1428 family)
MAYVDGFVLAVPKKNLAAYRRMSAACGKIWRKHGALEFRECVGDDVKAKPGCGVPFPKLTKAKAGEVVFFSYIVYKSRAHRDKVNNAAMKDPRMGAMMMNTKMPFDMTRMSMGGFKVLVDA